MRKFLIPFSVIYRLLVFVRNKLFDLGWLESKKYNIPIISVGNITVGGTGKTPHAEYLISWLSQRCRIALLSRGYKRETKGYVEVQTQSTVSQVGDEPLQIKQKFPNIQAVVDEKRVHGIDTLLQQPIAPELIILDDAFQHRHVNPGLKILLIDYQRPIFNDMMLPAGNLREPAKNSKRADIILITKCPLLMLPEEFSTYRDNIKLSPHQLLFFTTFSYDTIKPVFENNSSHFQPQLKNAEIVVVTGIANPLPFYQMLESLGATLHKISFTDHHMFSDLEIKQIANRFFSIQKTEKYIITTEKDAMRMRSNKAAKNIVDLPVYYIPIEVTFLDGGEEKFRKRIEEYLLLNNVKL